jgi:two-component system sensor histidine kinase PilS (NtrC family)
VVTSLVVSAVIIQYSTSIFLPLNPFYYLILTVYFLTLIYFLLFLWRKQFTFQVYLQILFDLLLITGLVYISGGLKGSFYFLYIFEIIAASIILSYRASLITAALSAICFGLLMDGMYFGLIPFFGGEEWGDVSLGLVISNIFLAWSVFFLVAILMNYLTGNLRKAKSELERAHKELEQRNRLAVAGEVSARVAHEIRNPLAAIAGAVQVLKEDLVLKPGQKDLMNIILRESRRVSHSIEQFLNLASTEDASSIAVDLPSVVRETLMLLERSGELNGAHNIAGNFRSKKVLFYGSPNHFKQIFWNLIKNSLRAMPKGGVLTVDIEQKKKDEIQLRIADTGRGMSGEEKKRVFEPFYSGFEDGIGMGMSVVQRIVEDYQGKIQLSSEIGRGTEVVITLPWKNPERRKTANKKGPKEEWTNCSS